MIALTENLTKYNIAQSDKKSFFKSAADSDRLHCRGSGPQKTAAVDLHGTLLTFKTPVTTGPMDAPQSLPLSQIRARAHSSLNHHLI